MQSFDPFSALLGGALIGLSTVVALLISGRIAGISGILGGLLDGERSALGWRLAFIAGLIIGAALTMRQIPQTIELTASWGVLLTAGVLVGVGTRLGSGCTSGHGICGVSRGSKRSIAATCLFVGVAMATVFVTRHLFGGLGS